MATSPSVHRGYRRVTKGEVTASGWNTLVDAIDADVDLVATTRVDQLLFNNAVKARVDAVISDAGEDSEIKRPASEFRSFSIGDDAYDAGNTPNATGAGVLTVDDDWRTEFSPGRRLRLISAGGASYSTITAVSLVAGDTEVHHTGGPTPLFDVELSSTQYGLPGYGTPIARLKGGDYAIGPSATITGLGLNTFLVTGNATAFFPMGRRIGFVDPAGRFLSGTGYVSSTLLLTGPTRTLVAVLADATVVPTGAIDIILDPPEQFGTDPALVFVPDALLTLAKFGTALAPYVDFQAVIDDLQGTLAGLLARIDDSRLLLANHAATGVGQHGAGASSLLSAERMTAFVADHDADKDAHRHAGGAFEPYEIRDRRNNPSIEDGYVGLDETGKFNPAFLPGPYGVKRVQNVQFSYASTADLIAVFNLPFAVVANRTICFPSFSSDENTTEAALYSTLELITGGTQLRMQRVADGSMTTCECSVVEFY